MVHWANFNQTCRKASLGKFLQNEAFNYHIGYNVLFSLNQRYNISFAKRCLLIGTVSQVLNLHSFWHD